MCRRRFHWILSSSSIILFKWIKLPTEVSTQNISSMSHYPAKRQKWQPVSRKPWKLTVHCILNPLNTPQIASWIFWTGNWLLKSRSWTLLPPRSTSPIEFRAVWFHFTRQIPRFTSSQSTIILYTLTRGLRWMSTPTAAPPSRLKRL